MTQLSSDRVTLVFIGDGVQLVRLPVGGGLGPLTPCGVGWTREMSRGTAEQVLASRPEMFRIDEVATERG